MTREEALKEYIIDKYGSVNAFCVHSGINPSTMASVFRRGLGGASGDLILKICKVLHISADKLLGEGVIQKKIMDVHEVTQFDLELLTAYHEKEDVQLVIDKLLGVQAPLPPIFDNDKT